MRAIEVALVLAGALLAAACLPVTTKAPLGTTVKPVAEPALLGTWKGRVGNSEEGPSYLHFLPGEDGAMTVLVVTPAHGKDHGSWSEYTAQTAALGSYRYLNVRIVSYDGKPAVKDEASHNIPVRYIISHGNLTLNLIGEKAAKDAIKSGRVEGKLTIYLIREKAAKAAIKSGRIEGTVEPGEYGDAAITAPPEKLDAFFASPAGAKLFTEEFATLKNVE